MPCADGFHAVAASRRRRNLIEINADPMVAMYQTLSA
jgi:hypothetical protein